MSGYPQDTARFMEDLTGRWSEAARNATGVWQGLHRQWAQSYRDLLDRQLEDDKARAAGQEWAEGVSKLFADALESQREARARFLESQRAMVDSYMALLDRMDPGKSSE